jgi:hypothetical protein
MLVGELILHASFATESLQVLDESFSDQDQEVLFNPDDARKRIKSNVHTAHYISKHLHWKVPQILDCVQ